jgi:hypothetical protein
MKYLSSDASTKNIDKFNTSVKNGDTVFVMFHSPDCGYCVNTLPIWKQMYTDLKDRFKHKDNLMIADISANVMMQTPYGKNIEGFPTILCITNKGTKIAPIENEKLKNEPRTIDSFIEWVELKTPESYMDSSDKRNNKRNNKPKKKYRVTPYPRMHHKMSRRIAKKGGRKSKKRVY